VTSTSIPSLSLLADARDDWVPAVVMGVGLMLLGGWFMRLHWQAWRRHAVDSTLDDAERSYYHRQFRRRMQASGIILVIGIMVPVGDSLIPWRKQDASVATLYWLFVLALTCWVLLLAMGDMLSTRTHSRAALSRLHRKQRELHAEAERLRSSARRPGNGQSN
jgi:hypothetical protein